MACGLARSEGLEPPAFRSVDARTGVRDCSDQSVTWGSPPPVVQVSSEHPKGVHPRGSQIPLPELAPPLVGGLPGDAEPGADLGPGVPAAAQALDCLGDGGVQLVREAGHEDECSHVAVCNPATVAAQDAPDECPVLVILDLPPRPLWCQPSLDTGSPGVLVGIGWIARTMEVICLLLPPRP